MKTKLWIDYTMIKQILILLCFIIILSATFVQAQENNVWHNKKCAVCLTYDDALNVDLDNVIPILDSLGLKATFYISGFFQGFRDRSAEWRTVAAKGNELGNHTLFHPCEGNRPDRKWVQPDYDLHTYSIQRMNDEIEMANVLLNAIDGKTMRTFAYPCGDTLAGDSSYVSKVKSKFIAARGIEGKMKRINEIDLYDIGSYMINGESGDALIALVKKAMDTNSLIVFLFHGVGGEHSINVSLEAHSKLLHFLKENEGQIWIAPMVEIAKYVNEYNQQKR